MSTLRSTLIAALAALALAAPATAETFKPTRFDDPAPNGCKVTNCSLREALIAANATIERDTVRLGKGTYEMDREGSGSTSGSFDIIQPAVVKGAGPARTRIDANRLDRVVEIGVGGDAKLSGLTVKRGLAQESFFDFGGGIRSEAPLELVRVSVSRSTASFGGGGVVTTARTTIKNSTISGNNAGIGGGLMVVADNVRQPDVEVRASTISGNAANTGGGIAADGSAFFGNEPPRVEIVNSTVTGNRADVNGGGIAGVDGAAVILDNATIAYNHADVDDVDGGVGGGLYRTGGAFFGLGDTLLAGNQVGRTGNDRQCSGLFSTGGGVAYEPQAGDGCNISGTPFDPAALGVFADHGGPTETVELLGGTAVGLSLSCPAKDQRGERRLAAGCDAGAFERSFAG